MKTTKIPENITPRKALELIQRWNIGERNEKKLKEVIARSAKASFDYATLKAVGWPKRFPEGEDAISKSSEYSYLYALDVIKGRWEPGEDAIMKDSGRAVSYAHHFLCGRWKAAEKAIAKKRDPGHLLKYAKFIGGRLPANLHNIMMLGGFDGSQDEERSKSCVKQYVAFVKLKEEQMIQHLSFIGEAARQEIMRRARECELPPPEATGGIRF